MWRERLKNQNPPTMAVQKVEEVSFCTFCTSHSAGFQFFEATPEEGS
jgi:hypothetical protein